MREFLLNHASVIGDEHAFHMLQPSQVRLVPEKVLARVRSIVDEKTAMMRSFDALDFETLFAANEQTISGYP